MFMTQCLWNKHESQSITVMALHSIEIVRPKYKLHMGDMIAIVKHQGQLPHPIGLPGPTVALQ